MDGYYIPSDGAQVNSQSISLVPQTTTTKTKSKTCTCCQCSKSPQAYVVMYINTLFLLAGIIVILIGSWSIANEDYYSNFMTQSTYSFVSWTIVAIGISIVILSLFGFYAALREHKLLLKIYAILIGCLMVLEIVLVIVALVHRDKLYNNVSDSFNSTIVEQYGFKQSVTEALDQLHQDHQCCGVNHYSDWKYSKWIRQQNLGRDLPAQSSNEQNGNDNEVEGEEDIRDDTGVMDMDTTSLKAPDTCCKTIIENCGTLAHPNNLYENGCLKKVAHFFEKNLLLFALLAVSVIVLQIITLVCTIVLLNRLHKQIVWNWY